MTNRPVFDDPTRRELANEVANGFAAALQGAGGADDYDAEFAADVLWGSPFGASVRGWDELNAIHHRLTEAKVAPPSRFEVVAAFSPSPGVVVTQIRRQAMESAGFSEMALYVLAERGGRWWLTAAQNTPVGVSPLDRSETER
ncbi:MULTISPECIES: DUF4440 domain-containing protein [unclassified Nocardia]|uniref:DUF4440 domain-containing protein n=1 Tax=unclassified Nocardia TaxID=2637762 RepID=UPI001CE41D06|nr:MULTISPECIES: DUF4440 domain-containing protein [unclassified Nocardia]